MPQETNLGPPVTEKIIFVIHTTVDKVEKVGNLWYAHFLGSWESLAFGEEKPFEEGDKVKISFEKVNDDHDTKNRQAPA